jgi:peroxiredoxin
MEMTPLAIGDDAPDLTLPDHSAQPVRLADRWSERPLVLLFLRHFG